MLIINDREFSNYNYQLISELGRNQKSRRITYLAKNLLTQQKVVIKQLNFDIGVAEWYLSKVYKREIATLQELNHPRIPRFLDSFQTSTAYYLVLEYKNAPSLGVKSNFRLEEIQAIAVSILEILVYLQQQSSPIIHRDIKPENILVDLELNAYLVDFGLSKYQNDQQELTTLVAGTPGFIPPEEYWGYEVTKSSDLYSLGASLICLLTHTHAANLGKLMDDNYRFHFQHLLSDNFSPQFLSWLLKMVEPDHKSRYSTAGDALKALKAILLIDKPEKNNLLLIFKMIKSSLIFGMVTIGIFTALEISLSFNKGNYINFNFNFQRSLIDSTISK